MCSCAGASTSPCSRHPRAASETERKREREKERKKEREKERRGGKAARRRADALGSGVLPGQPSVQGQPVDHLVLRGGDQDSVDQARRSGPVRAEFGEGALGVL